MNVQNKSVNNFISVASKSKPIIPITLVTFFLIPEIFFGFDFGFVNSLNSQFKGLATILKYFMRIFVTTLLLLIYITAYSHLNWNVFYVLQYIGYLFVGWICKHKVYDFVKDVHRINKDLARNQYYVGIIAMTQFMITLICGCLGSIYYCKYNNAECQSIGYFFNVISSYVLFIFFGLSVVHVEIAQVVLFYYLFCCVKKLKQSAENVFEPKAILQHYVDILDCFEKKLPYYSGVFAVTLLCVSPKILTVGYFFLFYTNTQESWLLVVVEIFFLVFTILHTLAPTVVAEMTNSQIDDIKSIMLNKLIIQTGDDCLQEKLEIRHLLWYMKERSLQRKVWGVMPLDLRLPVSLVGVWATYLIVIVQMTNLYG